MTDSSADALTADEAMRLLNGTLSTLTPDARKPRRRVLLAVSGGSDSLAMLVLLGERREELRFVGIDISVATVDHGIRPEAEAEARFVAEVAGGHGLESATLRWRGWNGRGNLQAAAREARYDLLTREAMRVDACAVVAAHHEDDQIETHLLAQTRGATGAGLAGMRPARALAPGVALLRPFLAVPRERLRAALPRRGVVPVRDPSNEDDAFARVRLRTALRHAEPGERTACLGAIRVARELRSADDAGFLEAVWADPLLGWDMADARGRLRWPQDAFRALERTHARRFVARAVTAAGGAATPPSGVAAERLTDALLNGRDGFAATLNGCLVRLQGPLLVFAREYGRAGPPPAIPGPEDRRAIFDRRFDVLLPRGAGAPRIVPLGSLGKGNEADRTLPVLVGGQGQPVAVPAIIAARLDPECRDLSIRPRVLWRFLADLGDSRGEPPRRPFTIVDPQEPSSPYRLVPAAVVAPGTRS